MRLGLLRLTSRLGVVLLRRGRVCVILLYKTRRGSMCNSKVYSTDAIHVEIRQRQCHSKH